MREPAPRANNRADDRHHWLAALACLVACLALALQYLLLMATAVPAVGGALATLRFLSYFTILGNLLVVLTTGLTLAGKPAAPARWFARPRVRGAVALYIAVVGIVYVTVLRPLWQPAGLQWWADAGLHYATPLLYLAWWLVGVRHGGLRRRDLPFWLLFPLAFLVWTLLRGAWLHEYPYPFLDLAVLGPLLVLRNVAGMLLLFLVAGALLIAIDTGLGRRPRGAT